MDRVHRILNDKIYIQYINQIKNMETDRRFCKHDFSHSLDVARICHIINLEKNLGYKKDLLYAMAFLHDIGRVKEYSDSTSHHEAGAIMARDILVRCGYDDSECEMICQAILRHKKVCEDNCELCTLLYRADKLSRNCFDCAVYDECYWSEDKKNKNIDF